MDEHRFAAHENTTAAVSGAKDLAKYFRCSFEELLNIFESIPMNVFFKDTDCRYRLASHVCQMLSGDRPGWTIVGKTDLEVQKDPILGRQYLEEDRRIIETGEGTSCISKMTFGDDDYYYEIAKESVFGTDNEVIGIVGCVVDVTELEKANLALHEASITDGLTGCRNRRYYEGQMRSAWSHDIEDILPVTFVICDCNHFKQVNDLYGHMIGDLMLQEVAAMLRCCAPEGAEVIRMGGDEFLIFCPYTDEAKARKLLDMLRNEEGRFRYNGTSLSVAFGSHTVSTPGDLDDAVRMADERMYADKKKSEVSTSTAKG